MTKETEVTDVSLLDGDLCVTKTENATWNISAGFAPGAVITMDNGASIRTGELIGTNNSGGSVQFTAPQLDAVLTNLHSGISWTTTKVPMELARAVYDALNVLYARVEDGRSCRACATEICPDCIDLEKAMAAAKEALVKAVSIANGPIPMAAMGSVSTSTSGSIPVASYSGNTTVPSNTLTVSAGAGLSMGSTGVLTHDETTGTTYVW